ncbi:hypothetical protein [Aliarcobacter cibarius]|uniref:Lipoprotein n=1 Tax=Aliarcobacter cibarius TaxID=255507 RepID=A0ABY2V789_9BACT|nr:hypothetical protein [Aliarcobacter cibarius]TLS95636.1 hypothetical protein FE247_10805 [Aliarcobacter cibarius]TLS97290.1 hypothetical protein FE245_09595 [Aliarcobacter cibarius]
MKKMLLLSTSITLSTLLFTGCNVVKHSVTYPAYLNASNMDGTKARMYSEKYGLHGGYLKLMEEQEWEGDIKNINNFDEKKQIEMIKQNALLIERINNPSELLQLEAVSQDWSNIMYIKNPTDKVKKLAFGNEDNLLKTIREYPSMIKHIDNPSENLQLEAIKFGGSYIEYIKDPSPNVQLKAVKSQDLNIKYIKNPSELIKSEAVRNNWRSISYIENPNETLQIEAVKKDWEAIKYIKNPTLAAKIEASKNAKMVRTNHKMKDYVLLDKYIKIEIKDDYEYSIKNLTNQFININNISFYYGKGSKGNDIYSTESFTLPPNSIKSLSFTHPEDVLYDKGPHVNFGFAVNYSIGTKNLEAYKVNKYLIAEFIEYKKY